MSTFVGISPFSNALWVVMHFHIAHTKFFTDTFVSHPGGPNEQFGTNEKLSWGMQGNLNWLPGKFPVPQYCLCSPVCLQILPLFPCSPEINVLSRWEGLTDLQTKRFDDIQIKKS